MIVLWIFGVIASPNNKLMTFLIQKVKGHVHFDIIKVSVHYWIPISAWWRQLVNYSLESNILLQRQCFAYHQYFFTQQYDCSVWTGGFRGSVMRLCVWLVDRSLGGAPGLTADATYRNSTPWEEPWWRSRSTTPGRYVNNLSYSTVDNLSIQLFSPLYPAVPTSWSICSHFLIQLFSPLNPAVLTS